jgi:hypothetical protein
MALRFSPRAIPLLQLVGPADHPLPELGGCPTCWITERCLKKVKLWKKGLVEVDSKPSKPTHQRLILVAVVLFYHVSGTE